VPNTLESHCSWCGAYKFNEIECQRCGKSQREGYMLEAALLGKHAAERAQCKEGNIDVIKSTAAVAAHVARLAW